MNISAFSEQSQLSSHTLRYYEKMGLLSDIHRNLSGHRVFTSKDLEWVKFIKRLKQTGMSLEDILAYSQLRSVGDSTMQRRQELLEEHHNRLKLRIESDQKHLQALEAKIQYYQDQKDA